MTPEARALRSLDGLSVGDALGRAWATTQSAGSPREYPPGALRYTDDTVMALAIVATLRRYGRIQQNDLAHEFAARFEKEPDRGYGAGAYWLLSQFVRGRDWRDAAAELFRGGSLGNGSAMRVAPLGAWFSDDLDRVVHEATASAEVTHQHPDGKAGAVAVAVAAALAAQGNLREPESFLDAVLRRTPDGATRERLARVGALLGATPPVASAELGDGREVRCSDTVPFALWCAARYGASYESAIHAALEGTTASEADRDTVAAIVGGVTALSSETPIPAGWLRSREPLLL